MSSVLTGYLAALVTLLSWTVGTFAFTHASRVANPSAVNRVRLFYAFLILTLVLFVFYDTNPIELFNTPSAAQFFWFGISGFVGLTLGDYFAFTAYRILGSRRTSLFSCVAPGAALVAGILILDEHMGVWGLMGMLVSVGGVLLLVLSRKEQIHVNEDGLGNYKTGILFATLGSVCQGLGLVLAKMGFEYSSNDFNAVMATWIRMLAGSGFAFVIGYFKTNLWHELKGISTNMHQLKPVLLGTIFGPVIGVSFSLIAAHHLNASVAQTLFSLLPVFVLMVSVTFFRERVPLRSMLAVLVSIAGVLILVWNT